MSKDEWLGVTLWSSWRTKEGSPRDHKKTDHSCGRQHQWHHLDAPQHLNLNLPKPPALTTSQAYMKTKWHPNMLETIMGTSATMSDAHIFYPLYRKPQSNHMGLLNLKKKKNWDGSQPKRMNQICLDSNINKLLKNKIHMITWEI